MHRVLRLFVIAFLLSFVSASTRAQQQFSPNTAVTTSQIQQWLQGNDPRLWAWAAFYAQRDNDKEGLQAIPKLLQHSPLSSLSSVSREAPSSLLDALIERDVNVPVSMLWAIAPSYPAQAAILASRLPAKDSESLLMSWLSDYQGGYSGHLLARVAAMLLGKTPSPAVVAKIVADAEEHLNIDVVAKPTPMSEVGVGGACGDGVGGGTPPGWPPTFTYDLEENNSQGTTLIQIAGDRINYVRHDLYWGWGSCFGVNPLSPATRHRLIAYWVELDPNDMPWQPTSSRSIVWHSQAQYMHDLASIISAQEAAFQKTVQSLHDKHLLSEGQFPNAQPVLTLSFRCHIHPCPVPGIPTVPQ